jgi:dolichol-phosphate mannosyltransferase
VAEKIREIIRNLTVKNIILWREKAMGHELDIGKKEKTLIIMPTYNERDNIVPLLDQVHESVPWVDILVVDDLSPDGTAEVVKEFAKNLENSRVESPEYTGKVLVLEREGERGLGQAYRAGLRYGLDNGYEILFSMDADHSHNPAHLPFMLAALKDHDVVIGSRYMRDGGTINWRIRRILLSWLANRFARFVLRLKGSDLTSGFRGYRRKVIENIDLEHMRSNGYSFLVEMLYHAQKESARVAEVPIIFFDRTMGKSKISRKEIYRGAFTLIRLRLSGKK